MKGETLGIVQGPGLEWLATLSFGVVVSINKDGRNRICLEMSSFRSGTYLLGISSKLNTFTILSG